MNIVLKLFVNNWKSYFNDSIYSPKHVPVINICRMWKIDRVITASLSSHENLLRASTWAGTFPNNKSTAPINNRGSAEVLRTPLGGLHQPTHKLNYDASLITNNQRTVLAAAVVYDCCSSVVGLQQCRVLAAAVVYDCCSSVVCLL